MYHINDKNGAVREVQKYLLTISQTEEYLPHITVDGIYNEDTKLAVISFQHEMGLNETGKTDRETFDLLFSEYVRINESNDHEKNILNIKDFPLKRGSSGSDVAVLNTHIRELSAYYPDLGEPASDYFSSVTEDSVKLLQEYFLEDITGFADIKLFERIRKEANLRKKFYMPK